MTDQRPPPSSFFGDAPARSTPQSRALDFELVAAREGVCEMRLPFRPDLVGDPATGALAGGAIYTLLDQASGMAISGKLKLRAESEGRELRMGAMATLDFRMDHLRPAKPGRAVIGRAECVGVSGEVATVRGFAYDDDPTDPIALMQAAFMLSGTLAVA